MAIEDIRISLQLLAETVENLEKEINTKTAAPKTQAAPIAGQQDMFGNWTGRPANDKNNAILARKLDSTIDKVQNLLREAGV